MCDIFHALNFIPNTDQEVQAEGKPFLLDPASKVVYKEVRGGAGAAPEQVGKWVKVRIKGNRNPGRGLVRVKCSVRWPGTEILSEMHPSPIVSHASSPH